MTKGISESLTRTTDPLDPLDPLAGVQGDQEDQEDHRISTRIADPLGSPRTPWSLGAPPLNSVPTRRKPRSLRDILGSVPTRRRAMADQVRTAVAASSDATLDELARRLGTDAGDVDLWAVFGLDHGGGRRLVFRALDGWVEVPRQ